MIRCRILCIGTIDNNIVRTSITENDQNLFLFLPVQQAVSCCPGDSFRLRLEKYMPYRYQKTIFVRIDDFDQELLDKYEPDDVIVITVERDQRYMEKLDSYIIQDSGE